MIGFLSGFCALLIAWAVTRRALRTKLLPRACTKVPVSAAMSRRFHAVRSDETLGDAARWLVETGQHLPIVDAGEAVGVLTRNDVVNGITHSGESAQIARAPHHTAITVGPDESVDVVVDLLARQPDAIAVVVVDDTAVGVVTSEQLATFVALHGERPAAR